MPRRSIWRSAAAIAAYVPAAAAALGGIDVLVNNASAFGYADDEAGWASAVAVDLMAVVRGSQAALPFLGAGGSIINIGSIAALHASDRAKPYGAIKAAVGHYTSSQAKTLAASGIRGELRLARLDRVPRRIVGGAAHDDAGAIRGDVGPHSVRPLRQAGGNRKRSNVPCLAGRGLGNGAEHRGGWGPAALGSADLSAYSCGAFAAARGSALMPASRYPTHPGCGLTTRSVEAGCRASAAGGRVGRSTRSPPQFGQAPPSRSARQSAQNVHSNVPYPGERIAVR